MYVTFSPDGKFVAASGSHTGSVHLWHTDTGTEYAVFRSEGGWAHGIAFTSDSKNLIFGNAGQRINFWNVGKKQQTTAFMGGHTSDVQTVAYSQLQ